MIVILENVSCGSGAYATDILLCEVQNEENAFGEMRRFLQINNIDSDVTYVKIVEEKCDCLGRVIPKHKEVGMYKGYSAYTAYDVTGATFGIYSQPNHPRLRELGAPEDWYLHEKKDRDTGETHLVRDEEHCLRPFHIESGEWYKCVKRYFADLAHRKAGDG